MLCEDCRHKYLQQRRQVGEAFSSKDDKGKKLRRKASLSSVSVNPPRVVAPVERQITLRENALFLLQLASSSGSEKNLVSTRRRKSLMHQPSLSSVNEAGGSHHRKVSAPPAKVNRQSLNHLTQLSKILKEPSRSFKILKYP